MSKKVTDIVGYFGPLGFFIAFLLGKRQESRFHLNQALVLLILSMALSALQKVAGWIPLLGTPLQLLLGLLSFLVFLIWLMALASAIGGKEKPMPFLGWVKLI